MICSPCKNCSREYLPKDKCAKECKLLKSIQERDLSCEKFYEGYGIDYTDEYSYNIPSSRPSTDF